MKNLTKVFWFRLISAVTFLASLFLFISCCWTAAADAQGAIALLLYGPIMFLLVAISYFFARKQSKMSGQKTAVLKYLSLGFGIYLIGFYVLPFVGFHAVSDLSIKAVAQTFKAVTGKSPMEWDKGY